jgi:hypothetical protein
MKMSKKTQTAGVPARSVGKNCGKLPVKGCGICVSHWDKRCRKLSYARWSGHLPKKLLPWLCPWKMHLKSMVRGSGPQRLDEPRDASGPMPSLMPGGWETALSSGSKPVVERSPARKCLRPTGRLSCVSDRLSALCSAGAMPGIGGQRRSGPSCQCRPPSVTSSCHC